MLQTPGLDESTCGPIEGRVARLYARLQDSMLRKQKPWIPESVLNDPEVADRPLLIRRAVTAARILEQMTIDLDADELIVGRTAIDGVVYRTNVSQYFTPEERAEAEAVWGDRPNDPLQVYLSHKVPDYPDVLARGFSGILAEVHERAEATALEPDSAEKDEKLLFYEAVEIECRAVIVLAQRYAELAEQKALTEPDPTRRAELLQIAEVCRRVPEHPARSFWEAVQCTWFVHYALFSTRSDLALGRFDQYCGPFLDADLASGVITLDQARELVECFWIKFNDRAQIVRENFAKDDPPERWAAGSRVRPRYAFDLGDAVNHWGQNIVLSGITPDGKDGTNKLTYLCLDCLERLQLTSPVTTVRLHRNSPPELIRRSAEVLKTGGAMPVIFNDEALVAAYVKMGVPLEEARDYANSNCWETMIAGKSDQEIIRGVNFLLILEWALNRGVSRTRGIQEGIDTGDPRALASFQQLIEAWKQQIDAYISDQVDYIGERYFDCTLMHSNHGPYAYYPLASALIKDSIARGKDVIRGGARYVLWHMTAEAVANCVDAMVAIKKFVFDDGTVTMDTVLDAIEKNWGGYEPLRQSMITRASKFANADPEADGICRELMDYFVARTRYHAARYPQILFPPSVGTYSWYQSIGGEVGASCDGRLAGDPVTSNFSPTFGMDRNGPTSAIQSYCQMSMDDLAAGAPIDLRFSGSHLKGEEGTERLAAFIRSFVDMGGNMMTLTITDVAILRAAIADPMSYRGLRVRMGGWSAYFVALSPEQQRVHLAKVEHGLA